MKEIKLLLTLFALIFLGCASSMHTSLTDSKRSPLPENTEVMVLQTYQKAPDSCTNIGTLHIGDNGFSADCGYKKVIEEAKAQVRKAGGNILSITEAHDPDNFSSCYRIYADILYRPNVGILLAKINSTQDSITKAKLHGATNYAILNIYRPSSYTGSLIGYNLHMNDSVICRAKNNSRNEIKVYKEGKTTIWAETEARDSVVIDVKFGEEYFIKCTIRMGALVGEPVLVLMDKQVGRQESEGIKLY